MAHVFMYLIIWTMSFLIAAVFIAVLARRTYMKRRYRLLDMERERCSTLLAALEAGSAIRNEDAYTHKPGTLAWSAVEEAIFRGMGSEAGRPEAARLLDVLGYTRNYIKGLKQGSRWEQALAAEKLGRIRCAAAVPHLIESLASEKKDLKLMAINSLGSIGDESAIPHLIRVLKQALRNEEDVSVRVLKSAIISFGHAVTRDLMNELGDRDWKVRAMALDILGEIGDRGAAAEFSRMLGDPEQEVRAKSAKGLGKFRHRESLPALAQTLKDPDWVVRLHSARAMGLIGEEPAITPLKEALRDKNWQVRAAAAEAMGRIGGRGNVELLTAFLEMPDRYAGEQALNELCRAGFYAKVTAVLEGEPLSNLKETARTDDKGVMEEDCLLEMAGVLSALSREKLKDALDALSSSGYGAGGGDTARVLTLIEEFRGRTGQSRVQD